MARYSICILLGVCLLATCDELLFVYECAADGSSYPKQEILDWTKGKSGHLTAAGVRQQYILGRELRKKYVDDLKLLDDKLNPVQMYIQAPLVNHAIASAYAQMAGLYIMGTGDMINSEAVREKAVPPNPADYSSWIQDLGNGALNYTYQSFPPVIAAGQSDTLLNPERACRAVEDLTFEYKNRHPNEWKNHQEVIARLTKALDVDPMTVHNVTYASELREAVVSSYYQGLPVIEEDKLRELIGQSAEMEKCSKYDYYLSVNIDGWDMSKIIATNLLNSVKSKLEGVMKSSVFDNGNNNRLKFVANIVSPQLIAAALKLLQFNEDKKLVPPASLLLFELYKKSSSSGTAPEDYYVRCIYNKEVDETLPYARFEERVKKAVYAPEEFDGYCRAYNPHKEDGGGVNWMLIGIISGSVVGAGLIVVLVVYLRMRCKSKTENKEEEEKILNDIKKEFE